MNRMHRKKLSVAVMNALNAGVVMSFAAPLAYAQQTPAPATQTIERIEVTGSRLPSLTVESVSPVNVISTQDIKWTGLTNTSEILNQLPSAFADQGQNLSNGATGTSSVNLRNLGPSRTLVLIDGRRLPAGSPNSWPTDINAIPSPLIQRVEVLTGGASAVYGSDAVAGVVNFIMNDHFEGVQLQWNGSGFNHQQQDTLASLQARAAANPDQFQIPGDVGLDGRTQNFNMLLGSNFANGKGNATVFFQWQQVNAVLQGSRNFSSCAISATQTALTCGGGSVTSQTGFFYNSTIGAYTIADAAGNVRPYNFVSDRYNFSPSNYFQRPQTTYSFNAFAHYDVDKGALGFLPAARVYTEFDFSNNHTDAQVAPGGLFAQDLYTMKNDNPLLSQSFKDAFGITPTQDAQLYIARRNVEGGGRVNAINLEDYRIVIGAKGDLLGDGTWNYNAWWQSATNRLDNQNLHYFSRAKATKALDVVTDPTTGQPICRSALPGGSDPNCVPYDIFHLGGVTQAALDYLNAPSFQSGYTSQSVVGLQFDSDLGTAYGWRTPWAKDGAAVAVGAERRVEKLQRTADLESTSGDQSGSGGASPDINGQYTVSEFYAEGRLPILQQQPWAHLLSVNGSYRYSSYNQPSNKTNTYGLGAEWAPVREYKARATYQRAIRAPNIVELYTPLGLNLFNMANDPCAGTATVKPAATLEECMRTGVTAAQYGKSGINSATGQYNFQQGGNPNLQPEKANTYTVGLVAQPLPSLSGTVDYWNIKLSNAIGVIPQPVVLNACLYYGELCDQVHRDANGTLWLNGYTGGVTTNTGTNSTDGVDLTVAYNQPITNWGSVDLTLVGTYVNSFKFQIGSISAECAGHFGNYCGNPIPQWRSKLRATWNTPWNWNASVAWRYFESVTLDANTGQAGLQAFSFPPDQQLGTQNYIDLAASWNVTKNFTVSGGCNNVFDKDPPILSSSIAGPPFGNGNTYPNVYDTLGRQFFLNVTAKF